MLPKAGLYINCCRTTPRQERGRIADAIRGTRDTGKRGGITRGDGRRPYPGRGTDLLVQMRSDIVDPGLIVDIKRITETRRVTEERAAGASAPR